MAYVPPPPGSTTAGQPTPPDVTKQSVHITDLPPEVRKSFLMSMVFFPSMIGAGVCVLMFLGWLLIFRPKEPAQYALELESPDMRRRWTAARELAEHITQYGEAANSRVYAPATLSALIKILENPDLDREASSWSPSGAIKQDQEKGSIRNWAAMMTGHVGAVLKDPADRDRAYKALEKALEEKDIGLFAARGLAYLRDPRAIEPLARQMNENTDPGVRWAAAEALGSVGWAQMQIKEVDAKEVETTNRSTPSAKVWTPEQIKEGVENADKARNALRAAYLAENSKAKRDETLMDNLAIALARVKDSAALDRLRALEKSTEPAVRDQARRALDILNGTEQKLPTEKK